jgi:hypothetical protein
MIFSRSLRLAACTAAILCIAALLLSYPVVNAGEKSVMHCFAWTSIKDATPADWDAFYKASDALPQKIKGITRVWYGKLESPLSQVDLGNLDADTVKKYRAGEAITVPVKRMVREYGMCMEFTGPEALKAYDADPYHKIWADAYAKVRVEGTTTYNILGQ